MFDIDPTRCIHRLTLKWSDQDAEVVPAWVAETDFDLAPSVSAALHDAIDLADVGYPPRDERSPLRPAWSAHLSNEHGWAVDQDAVYGLPGVVAGLYAAIMAFSAPGEGVVVLPPMYKPFAEGPVELGRRRMDVPLRRIDGGHELDLDAIAAACRDGGRLIMLCHPHNPTGTVFEGAQLRALAEVASAHDAVVVSDEVWAPLVHRGPFTPYAVAAGDLAGRSVSLVSMSKAFSFAGLKCGAAIVGDDVRDRWLAVPRRFRSSPGLLGMVATMAALDVDGQQWLEQLRTTLRTGRDALVAQIPQAVPGARVAAPDAGYLLWADLRDTALAEDPAGMLQRVGLRVSPGSEFGQGGEGHIRLNFATAPAVIDDIVARMATAVKGATR